MTDDKPMIVRELIAMQDAARGATCATCRHRTVKSSSGDADPGCVTTNWYACKISGEPVADNGTCVDHEWSREARVKRAVKGWVE